MTFCSSCGNEETTDKDFCSKCGSKLVPTTQGFNIPRRRSNWWYLLSIFISPIGGIIAYFIIKNDDPEKAKNCLIIGFILFAIGFVIGFASTF